MIRLLLSILSMAVGAAFFLGWSQQQVDAQLDKMQQKVHFTPGAESPVTPPVLAGGVMLLVGHYWLSRRVLRLGGWLALLSLLCGAALGARLFIARLNR